MSFEVGIVGLGKLGLPVAVAIAQQGHHVVGYDIDAEKRRLYRDGHATEGTGAYEPDLDQQLRAQLETGRLDIADDIAPVGEQELVILAVPTPEGDDGRFDVSALLDATNAVGEVLTDGTVVSVMSTVLPGALRNRVYPTLLEATDADPVGLAHTPSFTAMSSTVEDFLDPEFVLVGAGDPAVAATVEAFYRQTVRADTPIHRLSWPSAAMAKLSYNTAIGLKIVYANAVMELCHYQPGADADAVANVLQDATRRVASGKYLRGGMGDGGGCHPKDNRALGALAAEYGLSANPFEYAIEGRRKQTGWLADLAINYADDEPITVMGARYKDETNLTLDSPSLLLAEMLQEMEGEFPGDPYGPVTVYDPQAGHRELPPAEAHTFVVTVDAPFTHEFDYPEGSTVIDVWRCLDLDGDYEHIPVGVGAPTPTDYS